MTTYARDFARSALSVGKARDFVATVVGRDDRADDIRTSVSELATNAVQHTPPGRRFLVRIIFNESVVRIEVHDAGDGTPRLCTPTDTDDRGRGLLLVSAFADDWGVSDRSGPGKAVWAEFKVSCAVPPGGNNRHVKQSPRATAPAGVPAAGYGARPAGDAPRTPQPYRSR